MGIQAHADVVTDWTTPHSTRPVSPPAAARNLAVLTSQSDHAVNGIAGTDEPYLVLSAVPAKCVA
jgi:hypothetical protein